MTRVLDEELGMNLLVITWRNYHHLLQALPSETLSKTTKDGTTVMFICRGSSLLRETCRLDYASGQLMLGLL